MTVDDMLDEDEDEDNYFETDDQFYDDSQEPFPACPAYDPAIPNIQARAETYVQKLDGILEQFEHVNEDLRNMKSKAAKVMKHKATRPKKVATVGATGAGIFSPRTTPISRTDIEQARVPWSILSPTSLGSRQR